MEIQKGIPVPKTTGRPPKYDFDLDEFKKGDMIKIVISRNLIKQEVKIIRNRVAYYKNKNPLKNFTVRQIDGGVGIWRIT